ncbi:MAG: type II secretion system protein N [Allosphingosinicella sp.]
MRLRLPMRRSAFLATAFLFALVALLPMRLALDWLGLAERGLAARGATGSVWLGTLQEARIGPAALGDVEARLHLLPLLIGRARLSLASADAGGIEGAVVASRHSFGLDDVTGRFRLGPLVSSLPVSSLDLEDFGAGFASGRCSRAEGRVRAALTLDVGGIGFAPALGGQARCAGDALLLPLVSQAGSEQLNVHVFADGRYRLDLLVRSGDPVLRARLIAAGFRPVGNAPAMRLDGSF